MSYELDNIKIRYSANMQGLSNIVSDMYKHCEHLSVQNRKYEAAIIKMVQDGWLNCGSEGMSDAQQFIHTVYKAITGVER